MCSFPYPINELENELMEQEINSFDIDEMNLLKLYTDENDEIDTILCIEDSIELNGYCLIESYELTERKYINELGNNSRTENEIPF